jgi:hypothetical protein
METNTTNKRKMNINFLKYNWFKVIIVAFLFLSLNFGYKVYNDWLNYRNVGRYQPFGEDNKLIIDTKNGKIYILNIQSNNDKDLNTYMYSDSIVSNHKYKDFWNN